MVGVVPEKERTPKGHNAHEDQKEERDDKGKLGHRLTLVPPQVDSSHRQPPPLGTAHDAARLGLLVPQ
jgi:hypothetical protein